MHIDHKVLSDLQEVMEDGYLQLLETFLEDSERRLSQLHEAKDADELGMAAHSFKGAAATWGPRDWLLCASSLKTVRQQPLYGIEDLINRIDQEYLEVQRFYRGERQRISTQ